NFPMKTDPRLLCMGLFSPFYSAEPFRSRSGLDSRPSVAAEQVQLLSHRCDADLRADGGSLGSGDADDDLAGRQLARSGGNALLVLGARAIDEGFGADALDGFDGERQRDAAGRRLVGDDEIFRTDTEDAGFGAAELGLDLLGARRHQ